MHTLDTKIHLVFSDLMIAYRGVGAGTASTAMAVLDFGRTYHFFCFPLLIPARHLFLFHRVYASSASFLATRR